MILNALSVSNIQQRGFLPDLSDGGFSKYVHFGHMSWYVLATPRKLCISLIFLVMFSSITKITFFHELRQVGVNQYPIES